jgi:transposase-like protein
MTIDDPGEDVGQVHGSRCSPVRVVGERGAIKDKARIVAEIVASGESVSAVARLYGLSQRQLFGWRRELQASQTALSHAEELQFVPAVLDLAPSTEYAAASV